MDRSCSGYNVCDSRSKVHFTSSRWLPRTRDTDYRALWQAFLSAVKLLSRSDFDRKYYPQSTVDVTIIFPACSLVANELLIVRGVWMRFWVWFSAKMDTSLKFRILKSSYFLKLSKTTLKSEKGILIVNHEYNDNWQWQGSEGNIFQLNDGERSGHFKELFKKGVG